MGCSWAASQRWPFVGQGSAQLGAQMPEGTPIAGRGGRLVPVPSLGTEAGPLLVEPAGHSGAPLPVPRQPRTTIPSRPQQCSSLSSPRPTPLHPAPR